ncbi:MAG: DUF1343 domain-containing protein [Treponema sp.]|jgi:uncharacterized protein YbbC (DUF1343 family)|nr:DUF1343 domain-containing protein [Treponema sp.]
MGVLNGIDRLLTEDFGLKGKRLGLITGPTGLSAGLVSSIDILRERFKLCALFAPEHGVRGDLEAGGAAAPYQDPRTGLTVYSLYDGRGGRPTPAMLENIDCLLIDIQDVGSRFYTFISTMYNAMEECAGAGKTFVVLDRFNPINGLAVEGCILESRFKSFIGIGPIPQRHGMTMGELALFFNRGCGIGAELQVIPLAGWKREQFADETGHPWVNPSPNIPGLDAALVFPGTCIFEGTNVSEGRGTTKPFETIGAPWLDAEALAETLNGLGLPGFIFRPAYFKPWFSKFSGELCRGVQVHIVDRRIIEPVKMGLCLLEAVQHQDPGRFDWRRPEGAPEGGPDGGPPEGGGRYAIDLLAGSDLLRLGKTAEYRTACGEGERAFVSARQPYLLYG